MKDWLELFRRPQTLERDKEIAARVITLARFLPEPIKAQEFIGKLSANLMKDSALLLGKYLQSAIFMF